MKGRKNTRKFVQSSKLKEYDHFGTIKEDSSLIKIDVRYTTPTEI